MFYSELTNKAVDIAYEAHKDQKDKAGRPYFLHVVHVAEQMNDEISTCVALLHDTLEDTDLTAEFLDREFPPEVVEAVKLMTHTEGVDYLSYVRKISTNPTTRKVKLADLQHNLDVSRLAGCDKRLVDEAERRRTKYLKAVEILTEAENIR